MVGQRHRTRPRPEPPVAHMSPRRRNTGRAQKTAARREAILAAALDEFSARGFAATRLEDVARRAGVAKAGMSNESWLSAVSLAGDGDDRVIGARSITATWHLSVSDQVAPRKRLSRRALMENRLLKLSKLASSP